MSLERTNGIYHAATDDGLELPVVDVTHPAFALQVSQEELEQRLQAHIREVERRARVPMFIQNVMLGYMMKRSRLMRAITAAGGGFLTGMNTYILKVGPGNMDKSYASSIDRQISASLPGLSVRLRLQNNAYLLAEGLEPALEADAHAALHLLNIGGGPAIDSLNALIILQKQKPGLLAGRAVFIHILDLDEAGPRFGSRALAALQSEGGPLNGLPVELQHVRYNWSDTTAMTALLQTFKDAAAVVAASTEGALFEYGSDEEVSANLRALQADTPPAAIVVGSVTRADTTGRLLNGSSRAALQMRGIEGFTRLAHQAGWDIAKRLDRPSGHDVLLQKTRG